MDKYIQKITELTAKIPTSVIDFSEPREKANIPTQVSSEFVTNREQGDWAEALLIAAVNEASKNYIAVKYGKSDDTIAGDEGFNAFFEAYQQELDTIGKRPDLLIFKRTDYNPELGLDISKIEHTHIADYVKKAVAGIEVRSSAFLYDKYQNDMSEKIARCTQEILEIKNTILSEFQAELSIPARQDYKAVLEAITTETIHTIDFRVPSWRSDERLMRLSGLFKRLKSNLKELHKRNHLSITPKIEDIKVVYKWIETFGIPHYYFQVFFDKIYGISFEQILTLIANPDKDGEIYTIEGDIKNQNKQTIKIDSGIGEEIASKVDEPEHYSQRKEMNRGRLLFYVRFKGGRAHLNIKNLTHILGISAEEF